MGAIKGWFTAITGVIILSAMAEGILPSGNMKKYVRLLFGVIMVIVICQPFLKSDIDDFRIETESNKAYIESKNMEEKEREAVLRLYKANVAKQMISCLEGINQECEFEVTLDIETFDIDDFGKIKGVIVTVKTADKDLYINEKIEEVISQTYGVRKKNIAIKYTEAE